MSKRPGTSCQIEIYFAVVNHLYLLFSFFKLVKTVLNNESYKSSKNLEAKLIVFREKFDNLDGKMDFYLTTSASISVFSDQLVICEIFF